MPLSQPYPRAAAVLVDEPNRTALDGWAPVDRIGFVFVIRRSRLARSSKSFRHVSRKRPSSSSGVLLSSEIVQDNPTRTSATKFGATHAAQFPFIDMLECRPRPEGKDHECLL